MWTRREFLNRAAAAGGSCLGLGYAAPQLWNRVAAAAEANTSGRKLVVIELQGGNDGLNTVIPFADDAYYRARPTLGIPAAEVIKLDDHLGLHPAMKSWRGLWDAGRLAIVENCGYPQPNRSHFESMDIWHAGQLGAPAPAGWLGRASDQVGAGDLCFVGEGAVPSALSRKLRSVASLSRLNDLELRGDLAAASDHVEASDDLESAIAGRLAEVRDFSTRLHGRTLPAALAGLIASERPLAEHLSVIRTLIEKDQPFRVYYTALDGFDTHAQQRGTHENLWRQVSEAVSGFLDKLREKDRADSVAVFLFSEFGRRVKENGSQGTDHGAAAPVFLLGDHVRSGIQGGVPNLADLEDGDIRHTLDFRDVYASVLRDWLGVDPAPVLGGRDPALRLFT